MGHSIMNEMMRPSSFAVQSHASGSAVQSERVAKWEMPFKICGHCQQIHLAAAKFGGRTAAVDDTPCKRPGIPFAATLCLVSGAKGQGSFTLSSWSFAKTFRAKDGTLLHGEPTCMYEVAFHVFQRNTNMSVQRQGMKPCRLDLATGLLPTRPGVAHHDRGMPSGKGRAPDQKMPLDARSCWAMPGPTHATINPAHSRADSGTAKLMAVTAAQGPARG